MRLLVDADACPNLKEISHLAEKYEIPSFFFADTAHLLESDTSKVILCDQARESVDMVLINEAGGGDVVVTQDYGVASLVLAKGAKAIHPDGRVYSETTLPFWMEQRATSAKERKHGRYGKGPKKRTKEMKKVFLMHLESLLVKQLEEEQKKNKVHWTERPLTEAEEEYILGNKMYYEAIKIRAARREQEENKKKPE